MSKDFDLKFGFMRPDVGLERAIVELPSSDVQNIISLFYNAETNRSAALFTLRLWHSDDNTQILGLVAKGNPDFNKGNPYRGGGFYDMNSGEDSKMIDRHGRSIITDDLTQFQTVSKTDVTWCELREDGIYFGIDYASTKRARVQTRVTPRSDKKYHEDVVPFSQEEAERIMNGGDVPEENVVANHNPLAAIHKGESEAIQAIKDMREQMQVAVQTFNKLYESKIVLDDINLHLTTVQVTSI